MQEKASTIFVEAIVEKEFLQLQKIQQFLEFSRNLLRILKAITGNFQCVNYKNCEEI